jgi:hypothetical protein
LISVLRELIAVLRELIADSKPLIADMGCAFRPQPIALSENAPSKPGFCVEDRSRD